MESRAPAPARRQAHDDACATGEDRSNDAQQRVLDHLGKGATSRPPPEPGVAARLRSRLEEGVSEVAARIDDQLTLTKWLLSRVHGCERRFLAEDGQPVELRPGLVAGTLAHRAIQLSVTWRGPRTPLHLIEAAEERVRADGGSHAGWLERSSEAERAETLGMAAERVGKFLECFPPLKRQWAPTTECSVRAELAAGRIQLVGRVDLSLGQSVEGRSTKVFVDFKTGGRSPVHPEDLRFYALIEALRLGVPPRRVASYYLDTAALECQDVTEPLLASAAERVIEGVRRIVELRGGERDPELRPGPGCRFCAVSDACVEGGAYLAGAEGEP